MEQRALVDVDELLVPLVPRVFGRAVSFGLHVPCAILNHLREDRALNVGQGIAVSDSVSARSGGGVSSLCNIAGTKQPRGKRAAQRVSAGRRRGSSIDTRQSGGAAGAAPVHGCRPCVRRCGRPPQRGHTAHACTAHGKCIGRAHPRASP